MVKKKEEKKLATLTAKPIEPMRLNFDSDDQFRDFGNYLTDAAKNYESIKRTRDLLSSHKRAKPRTLKSDNRNF